MTSAPSAVLLDTCALIWLANGDPMSPAALAAITHAAGRDGVLVSAISAWEIGMLSKPREGFKQPPIFLPDAKTWFSQLMTKPAFKQADLTSDIAIDASHLPGPIHGDPGDRLIISTARHLHLPVITRDRKIIAYAEEGFVKVIPC